jgi:hypothetical protein
MQSSANNLCPGGTLTVVFTANSPSDEGPHTWPIALFHGEEPFTGGPSPTVIVDGTPPETAIDSGPPSRTNQTSASFAFSSEAGTTFECSLDGALFSACTTPNTYTNLVDGPHVFAVRAVDPAKNTGSASAYGWTIDSRPPTAAFAAGPSALSNSRSATFAFSTDEASAVECRLDTGGFEPCSSPASYLGLVDGAHMLSVRPTDAVGNVGNVAAYAWTIDATAPETTLGSRPRSKTMVVSATFTFSASEPVSFECRLDGSAFSRCSSPKRYAGLRRGRQHNFAVRSIDAAGNVDATPAAHRWAIGAAPRSVKRTSALTAPLPGARVSSPPLLRWRPVTRASYYNVQLFRGRVKVFSAWPRRPSLRLRSRWTYLGKERKLSPGVYRWYVWPAYSGDRYGRVLGQSTFIVTGA